MNTLSIVNWEKYQHYKHRNPPWIKLYHAILDDYQYGCLQDASKLLLISLFLLASRTGNSIPADKKWIQNKAMIKGEIDFKPLLDAGFITINGYCKHDASNVLASCQQNADSETETEKRRYICAFCKNAAFDIFYQAYPKKRGKAVAQKAWSKIKLTPDLYLKIINALNIQKKSHDWKKSNGQYIPYPSTWLNQQRWDDEVITQYESKYVA